MSAESGSPSRWWRLKESLSLKGSNCPDCNRPHFPKRPICPDCGSDANFQNSNPGEVKAMNNQSAPTQSERVF